MDWVPDYTVRFAVYWSLIAAVGVLWSVIAVRRFLPSKNLGRFIVCNFTVAFAAVGIDRSVEWLHGLTPKQPPLSFEAVLVWLCSAGVLLMWADLAGKIVIVAPPPTCPPCREEG